MDDKKFKTPTSLMSQTLGPNFFARLDTINESNEDNKLNQSDIHQKSKVVEIASGEHLGNTINKISSFGNYSF